jgi:hypothetical protein
MASSRFGVTRRFLYMFEDAMSKHGTMYCYTRGLLSSNASERCSPTVSKVIKQTVGNVFIG